MKGNLVIGIVAAASVAGMAAAWFLKDQLQPSATARFMHNGKRTLGRFKKMMGS